MAFIVDIRSPGDIDYPEEETQAFRRAMKVIGQANGLSGRMHLAAGVRVDPTVFPRHPTIDPAPPQLNDFVGSMHGYLLSRRAMDLVEAFEPGVHQFVPVDLRTGDDSAWPEPYWMFNMCTRLDTAIAEEHSNCIRGNADKPWWSFGFGHGPEKLAVHKHMVEHRAFWRDARYDRLFTSDRFMSAVEESGITGIHPEMIGPRHIEEV